MNNKHFIGENAKSFESLGLTDQIDGVLLKVDSGTAYRSGDQTGYVLEAECPYGTQAMADGLLAAVQGKSYAGFEAEGARLPVGAELGDGVTVRGLYGPLVRRRIRFGAELSADIGAPAGGDTDHEFGYTDPVERKIELAEARSRSYIDRRADEIRVGVVDEVDGKLAEIDVSLEGITQTVKGQGESLAALKLTADALSVDINGAEGSMGLKAAVEGLDFAVNDPDGAVNGKLAEIGVSLEGITETVKGQGESLAALKLTADALSVDINGAEGSMGLKAAVEGLDFAVNDPDGAVNGKLAAKIGKDENEQIVSMLNASFDQINIKGNRFTLDSDNFKVAADGTVTMKGADVSGGVKATSFSLNDVGIHTGEEEFTKYIIRPDYVGRKEIHSVIVESLIIEAVHQLVLKGYLSAKEGSILDLYSEKLNADSVKTLELLCGTITTYGSIKVNDAPNAKGSGTVTATTMHATSFFEKTEPLEQKYMGKKDGVPIANIAHGHAIVNHGKGANNQGTVFVSFKEDGSALPGVPTVVAVPYASDSTFVTNFCMGTITETGFNITYTRRGDGDTHFMWIAICG